MLTKQQDRNLKDSNSVLSQPTPPIIVCSAPSTSRTAVSCPECNSRRLWKDGLRRTKTGSVQRFLCRDCSFRFSEMSTKPQVKIDVSSQPLKVLHPPPDLADKGISAADFSFKEGSDHFPFFSSKDVAPHNPSEITSAEKDLNALLLYNSNRQVCAEEAEAKNLAKLISRQKWAKRGATGKIIEFAWWMKKQGYAERTIENYTCIIKILVKRGANILDPESIKEVLAKQK